MSLIKIFSVGLLIFTVMSCGNNKNTGDGGTPLPGVDSPQPAPYQMEGVVQIGKQGDCPMWIMTTMTSSFPGFYPVNLADEFKVHGLKVGFNYTDSRAPLPEGCSQLKAIVIEKMDTLP